MFKPGFWRSNLRVLQFEGSHNSSGHGDAPICSLRFKQVFWPGCPPVSGARAFEPSSLSPESFSLSLSHDQPLSRDQFSLKPYARSSPLSHHRSSPRRASPQSPSRAAVDAPSISIEFRLPRPFPRSTLFSIQQLPVPHLGKPAAFAASYYTGQQHGGNHGGGHNGGVEVIMEVDTMGAWRWHRRSQRRNSSALFSLQRAWAS